MSRTKIADPCAPIFYVYAYADPRDGVPFYIGKGHGTRDREHLRQSVMRRRHLFYHKLRKLLRAGVVPYVWRLLDGLTENEAFLFERFFILALGRRCDEHNTGPLCNLSDGGTGLAGWVTPLTAREKQAAAKRGKKLAPFTEEHKRRISAAKKGKRRSLEQRRKMSESHLGIRHTQATRRKMSQTRRGRRQSASHIQARLLSKSINELKWAQPKMDQIISLPAESS